MIESLEDWMAGSRLGPCFGGQDRTNSAAIALAKAAAPAMTKKRGTLGDPRLGPSTIAIYPYFDQDMGARLCAVLNGLPQQARPLTHYVSLTSAN